MRRSGRESLWEQHFCEFAINENSNYFKLPVVLRYRFPVYKVSNFFEKFQKLITIVH